MIRDFSLAGQAMQDVWPLALPFLLAVALLGCNARPLVGPEHFEALRRVGGELDAAHQSVAKESREAYLRLLVVEGRARLDSAHAACTIQLLEAVNVRLQFCEGAIVAAHIDESKTVRGALRDRLAQYEARELVGEGDLFRQALEARKLLANIEESARSLSAAMQVGGDCARREMATALHRWEARRLVSGTEYEQQARALPLEFENGEGKVHRDLLDKHSAFDAKVAEIEKLLSAVPTESDGAALGKIEPVLSTRRWWVVEDRLRDFMDNRNGELLSGELGVLEKECREEQVKVGQLQCGQSSCNLCSGRVSCTPGG